MKTVMQILFWINAALFVIGVNASLITNDATWATLMAQSAGFMAVANYFLGRDE